MLDQKTFFEKYNINEKDFDSLNIKWEVLAGIHDDYEESMQDFEETGNYISSRLRKVNAVHSLRFRVKDPNHLIEKIIRKKTTDPDREISIDNYKTDITDLIGVRALHLFKEDWEQIHDFITKTWDSQEDPTANVRNGDSEEFLNKFKEKKCSINNHKYGYRSVHYIIKTKPAKEIHLVEIQVRTIFEEGFSEIDHKVRYPYFQNNPMIEDYLSIFNRLAGSADEMGSYVKKLKDEISQHVLNARDLKKKNKELEENYKKLSKKLNNQIQKLQVAEKERKKLQETFDDLNNLIKPKSWELPETIPLKMNTEGVSISIGDGSLLNDLYLNTLGSKIKIITED